MIEDILDREIKPGDLVVRNGDDPEVFIVVTKSRMFNTSTGYFSPKKPVYLITNFDEKEKELHAYLQQELEYKKWSDKTNDSIIKQIVDEERTFIRGHIYCTTSAELLLCAGYGQQYNKTTHEYQEQPCPLFVTAVYSANYANVISGRAKLTFDFDDIYDYRYKLAGGTLDMTDRLGQKSQDICIDENIPVGVLIGNDKYIVTYIQKEDEVLAINEFLALDIISGDAEPVRQHFDDTAFL